MPTISFIIPAYNEATNLRTLHDGLSDYIKDAISKKSLGYEIIYVDDGSTDKTIDEIKKIASKDAHVKYISFSRNFGKEAAVSCGLHECNGDAAIIMDADGQHPKELIPIFVDQWQSGNFVVVGVRKKNVKEGLLKRYGSKLFYKIQGSIDSGDTVPGSTDFRLLDRRVIEEFNKLSERNRITRGLIDWLGFKRTYIEFDANERNAGVAAYNTRKLFKLAMNAFVAHSTKPLQVTGVIGLAVTLLSLFLLFFILIEQAILDDPLKLAITGTAILGLFTSLLIGIVLVCQWLMALYIESIHTESLGRPLYIIETKKIKP